MKKADTEMGIESEAVFEITVKMLKGDRARVEVRLDDAEFIHIMCAAEYMMRLVAERSEASFRKTMKALCKGAKTYSDASLTVVTREKE